MSEWIEHDGNGAPDLPIGTMVRVRWVDGSYGHPDGAPVELFDWRWVDPFDDIGAYEVVTEADSQ